MKNYWLSLLVLPGLLQANLLLAQNEPDPPATSGAKPGQTSKPRRAGSAGISSTEPAVNVETGGLAPSIETRLTLTPSAGNNNFSWSYGRSVDSIPPVVIDFSSLDDKAVQGLQEDLSVMTYLVNQTLEEGAADEEPDVSMGIPLLTGSRSVRALYLGDLGACFMIKVNFPVFGQTTPEPQAAATPPADDEWNKAKIEVLGGSERNYSGRTSAYNPDLVKRLQKQLIIALKNATNIRHLKSKEAVIISVFGAAQTSGGRSSKGGKSASNDDGDLRSVGSQGTVMTLRAAKSDVDAFAKGKLSLDEFTAKVKVSTYNGSGSDITSINSWIKSGASSGIR